MEQIVTDKKYGFSHLIAYLRSKGLPASKNIILDYEGAGLIPSPRSSSPAHSHGTFGGKSRRTYYGFQLQQIAETIRGVMDGTNPDDLAKLKKYYQEKAEKKNVVDAQTESTEA